MRLYLKRYIGQSSVAKEDSKLSTGELEVEQPEDFLLAHLVFAR